MENQKEEHIIKNLIYEESARNYLKDLGSAKQVRFTFLKLAASILVLIVAIGGFYYFNQTNIDHQGLTASVYTFPVINKSRSGDNFIVDSYVDNINRKDFNTVLEKLNAENLSEKDIFYKAHILFERRDFEQVLSILNGKNWEDEYYEEGSNWLIFLAQFNLEYPKTELLEQYNRLNEDYQSKAEAILNVIE